MCGICGVYDPHSRLSPIYEMNNIQQHRGPNDEGYLLVNTASGAWQAAAGPDTPEALSLPALRSVSTDGYDLALGSRRLAILDLSPAGHMPMGSQDCSLWITFNGEVYNYRELRQELSAQGYVFASDSDTDVILAAYQEWGTACLSHFNGMFAFAIWDAREKRLFCARDRFGVKPFYYYWDRSTFLFASELKSLLQHPVAPRTVNDAVIFDYLTLGQSDHSQQTFFAGIVALPPGHFLLLNIPDCRLVIHQWWSAEINPEIEGASQHEELRAYEEFTALLEDAVRLRLRSDVPVGSALSGGLDSSAVVCLANKLLLEEQVVPRELVGDHQKTFTARYREAEIDEYVYSHKIVEQTGAEEFLAFPQGGVLWSELESFIWHMDEPVNSTSQYAQWNVMRLARSNGVTVLLDGQGGDEILAGYYHYLPHYVLTLAQRKGALQAVAAGVESARVGGAPVTNTLLDLVAKRLPWRLHKLVDAIRPAYTLPGTGGSCLQEWQVGESFLQRNWERRWQPPTVDERGLVGILYGELTSTNLPKLLRYEDRNSMAFSLETRLPFLDFRLVKMVFSLPLNFRIRKGWTKWILRKSMEPILPQEVCWRRTKLGFPTPEFKWLEQGSGLIRSLLQEKGPQYLADYVQPGVLERICAQPDGDLARTPGLWRMVNLIVWMDLYFGSRSQSEIERISRAKYTNQ